MGKIIPINLVACFLVSLVIQSDTTKMIIWTFKRDDLIAYSNYALPLVSFHFQHQSGQ